MGPVSAVIWRGELVQSSTQHLDVSGATLCHYRSIRSHFSGPVAVYIKNYFNTCGINVTHELKKVCKKNQLKFG